MANKGKYWYYFEHIECTICGENHCFKSRVYDERHDWDTGIEWCRKYKIEVEG